MIGGIKGLAQMKIDIESIKRDTQGEKALDQVQDKEDNKISPDILSAHPTLKDLDVLMREIK